MRKIILVFASLLCLHQPCLAITAEEASALIKKLPCKDDMTVEQVLDQSIRSHSQRDIGWRNFQEDGYVDVERAILINKSMELRYRWRVKNDNSISIENDRTEKLCHSDP